MIEALWYNIVLVQMKYYKDNSLEKWNNIVIFEIFFGTIYTISSIIINDDLYSCYII